jgi:xylan 1,4-beta-xylosidase
MAWGTDGWLRTADGLGIPSVVESAPPALGVSPSDTGVVRDDFNSPELPLDFQWLRSPYPDELFSLSARKGHLRLYGRESMGSLFHQALVARRQQAFCYTAVTVMEFEPNHYQQSAGLTCYYGGNKFHYCVVSHDDVLGKHIRVMSAIPDGVSADAFTPMLPIRSDVRVELRVDVDFERLRFAYRYEDEPDWLWIPQQFDASILSDEATLPGAPNFTGAFVGVACQDVSGAALHADFDWFSYVEREYVVDPVSQ